MEIIMTVDEIKKAVEYKQGHFNMVQYILKEKPDWSISVYDVEENKISLENSKDYKQIRKAIKDYQTEIVCYDKTNKRIGWALFIPYNETDEDIVSDYSDTLTLNKWAEQFEKLHEQLNKEE
jgi:regulation of enolase protein 1 (concanavalin A-like superfamily)